ncbi:magnesium/cobalt transporter CorA [Bacillus sp. REN10]|uniref:magnesium/cobalt transporter CorA n=1 Tax=Bacillus sp. REN10 TaxID=2782541 RepID=UPI00193B0D63|nr:magnesium/cobalt transporter CorA [Bacillus sp. REN10]
MIRTCALNTNGELLYDLSLEQINKEEIKWYWIDFAEPSAKEKEFFSHAFHFHPLAIEDCLDELVGRPKLDFYDQYYFFLVHALDLKTYKAREVDIFINDRMIVTFHNISVDELNHVWEELKQDKKLQQGTVLILHRLIDRFVDEFFPLVYEIEDQLNQIDEETDNYSGNELIDRLFDIRHDMAKLRQSIFPMRDLVYRMLNSTRLEFMNEHHIYFRDIYDHLLKLAEMLESYRDFSSDLRDNYVSVNSNKMNEVMMTLTVITTIFMPLTFIAGIYGMNFRYMPELENRYGYFVVIGIMLLISLIMIMMFNQKGWLRLSKKQKKTGRKVTFK